MATTVGNFSAIDDSEVDAESPITETLVTRLRDNSYWIDAGTRQTTQTSTTRVLTPDGSGGVQWQEIEDVGGGVDGTKGSGFMGSLIGSPTVIAIVSGKKLLLNFTSDNISGTLSINGTIILDASDDTYVANSTNNTSSTNASGTVTTSFADLINLIVAGGHIRGQKNGSNYEFYENTTGSLSFTYIWL
jgi:hypothetical protein